MRKFEENPSISSGVTLLTNKQTDGQMDKHKQAEVIWKYIRYPGSWQDGVHSVTSILLNLPRQTYGGSSAYWIVPQNAEIFY